MNKNTVNAVQARINKSMTEFTIGHYRYIIHNEHPEFMPFVLRYTIGGNGEPFHVGNIVNGIFMPDDMPVRKEGGQK